MSHALQRGFWEQLQYPIIGLAPMDGVTDAPFRFIVQKYGKPHVIITEFTSVEGICAGALKTLIAFRYDESERPVVAQVFGSTPEAFYKASFVVAALGFDGIDINMGCPASNVAGKGAGAALILTPELAKEIIRSVQRATIEWADGKNIDDVGLPESIVAEVKKMQPQPVERKLLPVSVKTRIGYNSVVVEEWVKHLLETRPVNISLHGRTLKQLYSGQADWDAIARAAEIIHQTDTTVLGNGDIKTLEDAKTRIKQYGVDGVLIGRAAFGNPWIFQNKDHSEISIEEKFAVALEHSRLYEKLFGERLFFPMRKHLAWYCKGFTNASEIRQKLMQTANSNDVASILMASSS